MFLSAVLFSSFAPRCCNPPPPPLSLRLLCPIGTSFTAMKTSRLLAAVCFLASANAMAFQGPKPTSADEGHAALMRGWTPRPTQKPENHFDLRKRAAASGSLVGYDAPDNTCGYVSGSLGEPARFLLDIQKGEDAELGPRCYQKLLFDGGLQCGRIWPVKWWSRML